jgi:hypothetical protein
MPAQARSNSEVAVSNHFSAKHVSAKSQFRAKTVFALSFAAVCAMQLPVGSARAGFLDDLIGAFTGEQRSAPAQRYYGNSEGTRRAVRHHVSSLTYYAPKQSHPRRHAVAHAAAAAAADKQANAGLAAKDGLCYAVRPQGADLGQSDAILHDATLRQGDSVMTAQGLRVFEGGSACPHKTSEFLALAEVRDVSKSKLSALIAIEKAVKTPVLSAHAGSFLGSGKETPQQEP